MIVCPFGAAQVRISIRGNAKPWRVTAQQLLYVAAEVEHQTEAEESLYDVLALYPADTMLQAWQSQSGSLPVAPAAALARTHWFDALAQQFVQRRIRGKAAAITADMAAIEWLLVSAAFNPEPCAADPARPSNALAALLQAIDADLGKPWSLDQLARRAHTSRASVVRLFHGGVGTSPAAYLQQRRMQEAASLLRRGQHAVSEVAERVGYSSQAAFSTAFRRHFGCAPSAVRCGAHSAILSR